RSLELHAEAAAHERSASSHKCTTLNPPSPAPAEAQREAPKRHLRHVTPGARTPDLIHFGCDNLPHSVSAGLVHPERLKEISSATEAAAAGAAPQLLPPRSTATAAGQQGVQAASNRETPQHGHSPAMPSSTDHTSSSTSSSSGRGARSSRHRGRKHTRAEPFPPPPADPQGAGTQQQPPGVRAAPFAGQQQVPEGQSPESAHVPASKGRGSRWRGLAKEPGTAQAGYSAGDGHDLGQDRGIGRSFPEAGQGDSWASQGHNSAANTRGQEGHSLGPSTPAVCSYWVHDLVRPKRVKAAEVAIATGEPPVYVLR
ncbi:hypothetical protein DUNSADRAFT_6072, partial [Dunaliella salina]